MFSERVLADTAHWAETFGREWRREVPMRIHSREIAADGSPEWHPEFGKWLTSSAVERDRRDTPQPRLRTTKAMRRLRKIAPREYEVLYRLLILGDSIEGITVWLNERAARNNIPLPEGRTKHYRLKDTVALIVAGTDHVRSLW